MDQVEQDAADAAEAQPARPGTVPVLPSENRGGATRVGAFTVSKLVQTLRTCPGIKTAHTMSVESRRRVEVRHRLHVHG